MKIILKKSKKNYWDRWELQNNNNNNNNNNNKNLELQK